MPLSNGETFAGFRIVRLLGSGGMGEVYLVQHPRLPRRNALKVLPTDVSADAEYRARFNREADLASTLWHPHIVSVHDRGEYDDQLWISMDFVDGLDAARLLATRYPVGMPVDHVVRIVTAVASALDYAHKQGLLHRDVKPANIMLTNVDDDGEEQRILLADFGIARSVDDISGLTATNMTVGTVAYSAPEQLMGEEIDGRADQYALAATAYHLLTGSHLFPHSNPAVVISRHLNSPPPALADTHPELAGLDPVLATALAKDPESRFSRCSGFAEAFTEKTSTLGHAASDAPTVAAPIIRKWHAAGSCSRKRMITITAALAAVVLVGVVMLGWHALRQHQPPVANVPNSMTTGPSSPTLAPPSQTVLPFSGLNSPSALAVDSAGDVYVADSMNNRVLKLAPGSSTPTVLPITGINHPYGLAVDTAGALYIGDAGDKQFVRVLKVPAGSTTPTVLPFAGQSSGRSGTRRRRSR
jgi:serine/threonine-protein kinase